MGAACGPPPVRKPLRMQLASKAPRVPVDDDSEDLDTPRMRRSVPVPAVQIPADSVPEALFYDSDEPIARPRNLSSQMSQAATQQPNTRA